MRIPSVFMTGFLALACAVPAVWGGAAVAAHTRHPGASVPPGDMQMVLSYSQTQPVPVPRISGTLTVPVPLYPHSSLSAHGFPLGPIESIPGSPYERQASSRIFQVNQPERVVSAWYTRVFTRQGDKIVTSGSSGDFKTGVTEDALGFSRSVLSGLTVNMTFYQVTPSVTRYSFFATDVAVPLRPRRAFVPADVVRVTGSLWSQGQTRAINTRNRAAIHQLVSALNGPRQVDAGAHGCPAVTRTANLSLHPQNGKAIPVSIASECGVSINQIPLTDNHPKALWQAVKGLVR